MEFSRPQTKLDYLAHVQLESLLEEAVDTRKITEGEAAYIMKTRICPACPAQDGCPAKGMFETQAQKYMGEFEIQKIMDETEESLDEE